MSIEAILLVIAFIVLPLIQQLRQGARKQREVQPAAPPPGGAPTAVACEYSTSRCRECASAAATPA
jgi:hypothetical protein